MVMHYYGTIEPNKARTSMRPGDFYQWRDGRDNNSKHWYYITKSCAAIQITSDTFVDHYLEPHGVCHYHYDVSTEKWSLRFEQLPTAPLGAVYVRPETYGEW